VEQVNPFTATVIVEGVPFFALTTLEWLPNMAGPRTKATTAAVKRHTLFIQLSYLNAGNVRDSETALVAESRDSDKLSKRVIERKAISTRTSPWCEVRVS
jgi:hypothetical protein